LPVASEITLLKGISRNSPFSRSNQGMS
jgi:hypothetical protein